MNIYIYVNGVEIYKFREKYSEINASPLYLGNVSKDFSVYNMTRIGLYRYACDCSVDYDSMNVAEILDIHKYLWNIKGWNNIWIY